MTFMKKIYQISLFVIVLLLAGCQSTATNNDTPNYVSLPTIESNYDENVLKEFDTYRKQGLTNHYEGLVISATQRLHRPDNLPSTLFYDSGIYIQYPSEGVKGVFAPLESISTDERLAEMLHLIDSTALNALVLDFKDDHGNILSTLPTDSSNQYINNAVIDAIDYPTLLKTLEQHNIYPIARIVTFKDSVLSTANSDFSFKQMDGELWTPDGSYYSNPFLREVWDYNVAVAIEAAKMGFKEIQFDYIRFSDSFAYDENQLIYSKGEFENYVSTNPDEEGVERVAAITQFLAYAREQLAPYGVKVSADLFGYTAVAVNAPDTRNIGQNFIEMASNVDVISSMIYPSHWGVGFFGITYPDLQPFDLIDEYMYSEEETLSNVSQPVTTRPWLQDFTDYSLPEGTYQEYGTEQVQEQINALHKHNVHEFLLWNPFGTYSPGVNYAPELTTTE